MRLVESNWARSPYLWLTLLCATLYLPGIATVPPIDRDEARYVQATRQMLESGDLISIRFQEEARHKKPVGIHWLQAASVGLLSDAGRPVVWPYRLPSVIGAWAAVLMLYGFARAHLGTRAAGLAAVGLAVSLALVVEAHQAKTDAVLLASVVASQLALGRAYLAWRASSVDAPDWRTVVTFWAGIGLGFLLKGPVAPAVVLLTLLTLVIVHRQAAWLLSLQPTVGLLIVLSMVLPWSAAVTLGSGGDFFRDALLEDWLPKLLTAQESHGAPPGYYALTALVSLWPASVLALPALVGAWRDRADPLVALCLAWAVPTWLLLELLPTKLPHYVLPLFPALVLLIARLASREGDPARPSLWLAAPYVSVWLLALVGVAGVLVATPIYLGLGIEPWAVGLAVVLVTAGVVSAVFALRRRLRAAILAGAAGALVFAPWLAAGYVPALEPAWVTSAVARAVEPLRRYPGEVVAVAGYGEPSLVFLLGTRTRVTDAEGAAHHLATGPSRLAVVSEARRAAFEQAVAAQGMTVELVSSATGFQYSKGRWVTLNVYVRRS
jgi:4-amino-4-deoxy-L-arabinose transferase-like glycosyltransferase